MLGLKGTPVYYLYWAGILRQVPVDCPVQSAFTAHRTFCKCHLVCCDNISIFLFHCISDRSVTAYRLELYSQLIESSSVLFFHFLYPVFPVQGFCHSISLGQIVWICVQALNRKERVNNSNQRFASIMVGRLFTHICPAALFFIIIFNEQCPCLSIPSFILLKKWPWGEGSNSNLFKCESPSQAPPSVRGRTVGAYCNCNPKFAPGGEISHQSEREQISISWISPETS